MEREWRLVVRGHKVFNVNGTDYRQSQLMVQHKTCSTLVERVIFVGIVLEIVSLESQTRMMNWAASLPKDEEE